MSILLHQLHKQRNNNIFFCKMHDMHTFIKKISVNHWIIYNIFPGTLESMVFILLIIDVIQIEILEKMCSCYAQNTTKRVGVYLHFFPVHCLSKFHTLF